MTKLTLIKKSIERCQNNFYLIKFPFFTYIFLEFLMKIKNFPVFFDTGTVADFILTLLLSLIETLVMINFLLVFLNKNHISLKKSMVFLPGYILYSLIYGLTVILGLVLFLVPGVFFLISLFFTPLLSVVEPDSEQSFTKRSKELVKGHWWFVFNFALLSGILFIFSTLNNFITDPYGQWIAALFFSIVSTVFTYFTTALYFEVYLYLEKNLFFSSEKIEDKTLL